MRGRHMVLKSLLVLVDLINPNPIGVASILNDIEANAPGLTLDGAACILDHGGDELFAKLFLDLNRRKNYKHDYLRGSRERLNESEFHELFLEKRFCARALARYSDRWIVSCVGSDFAALGRQTAIQRLPRLMSRAVEAIPELFSENDCGKQTGLDHLMLNFSDELMGAHVYALVATSRWPK